MPALEERLRGAWLRHPLVAFARHRKVITFYQQLHALIRAGVPLPTAFTQLVEFAPDAAMKRGLSAVARDVRGGDTLGGALRKHGALFDDANVELIAFAEEAGRLEPVCAGIIAHLERVQRQRWQAVFGALWPAYLLAGFIFVGPLLGVATQMKPGASVGGLYLGGLMSTGGLALLVGAVVLGLPFLIAALDLEAHWDALVRSVPFVSAPMRKLAASRFVLGLGLANASGMEFVRALRLSVKATSSASLARKLHQAEATLRHGGTLTDSVRVLGLLETSELGTLSVAETTGTLDETLTRLSTELQEQSLRAMRLLVILVTGLIAVVLLAKIVAGMLAVIFGPVKDLYDAAGNGKYDG
ncbi:MAG TPA: type II secretion system F family protein [Archangium sp.]